MGPHATWNRVRVQPQFHRHFHGAVIDGGPEYPAGGVVFWAVTRFDAFATYDVQERIRQRLLRVFVHCCLLPEDAARAMGQ